MRYRRLSYRYTMVVGSSQTWPLGVWQNDRLRLVDLAGVEEDDLDVQLFEDVLVVEGRRQLPSCQEGAVYHAAEIRQGPFRVELALPPLWTPAFPASRRTAALRSAPYLDGKQSLRELPKRQRWVARPPLAARLAGLDPKDRSASLAAISSGVPGPRRCAAMPD
jgi:hypothetical protein